MISQLDKLAAHQKKSARPDRKRFSSTMLPNQALYKGMASNMNIPRLHISTEYTSNSELDSTDSISDNSQDFPNTDLQFDSKMPTEDSNIIVSDVSSIFEPEEGLFQIPTELLGINTLSTPPKELSGRCGLKPKSGPFPNTDDNIQAFNFPSSILNSQQPGESPIGSLHHTNGITKNQMDKWTINTPNNTETAKSLHESKANGGIEDGSDGEGEGEGEDKGEGEGESEGEAEGEGEGESEGEAEGEGEEENEDEGENEQGTESETKRDSERTEMRETEISKLEEKDKEEEEEEDVTEEEEEDEEEQKEDSNTERHTESNDHDSSEIESREISTSKNHSQQGGEQSGNMEDQTDVRSEPSTSLHPTDTQLESSKHDSVAEKRKVDKLNSQQSLPTEKDKTYVSSSSSSPSSSSSSSQQLSGLVLSSISHSPARPMPLPSVPLSPSPSPPSPLPLPSASTLAAECQRLSSEMQRLTAELTKAQDENAALRMAHTRRHTDGRTRSGVSVAGIEPGEEDESSVISSLSGRVRALQRELDLSRADVESERRRRLEMLEWCERTMKEREEVLKQKADERVTHAVKV